MLFSCSRMMMDPVIYRRQSKLMWTEQVERPHRELSKAITS
jgi:hypothetical protein